MPQSQRQIEERQLRKEQFCRCPPVFKKNGLEGSTMDEIANASGFGKATLLLLF